MFLVVGNLVQRLFEFGADQELLRRGVVLDPQDIGLAADLAVFDIGLAASSGLVHCRDVPLSAGGALEARFHCKTAYLSG